MIALSTVILFLTAIGFVGFGAAAALSPSRIASLTQLVLPTPSARTDFAATYGGFQIGFGAFLVACTVTQGWIQPGFWAAIGALSGFALVRLIGILRAGGRVQSTIWIALVLEVSGAILNLWALQRMY
jgi:Domain of unknown function (DUF4345)